MIVGFVLGFLWLLFGSLLYVLCLVAVLVVLACRLALFFLVYLLSNAGGHLIFGDLLGVGSWYFTMVFL